VRRQEAKTDFQTDQPRQRRRHSGLLKKNYFWRHARITLLLPFQRIETESQPR